MRLRKIVRVDKSDPRLVRVIGVWCAIGYLTLTGCGTPPPTAPKTPPVKVVTVEAISEEIVDYDEYIGRTEAYETVDVRARVNGYVQSVHFADGTDVKQGDLLFQIEPDAYEAIQLQSVSRIDLWQAKLNLAQAKLTRAKPLRASGAISEDELQEHEASVAEAQAAVVAAKADAERTALDVKYTKVTAPISGRIDRAFVTPGNIVTGGLGTGTSLTRIVRNDPIYAYFEVDERSILKYQRSVVSSQQTTPDNRTLATLKIPCSMQLSDEKDFPHSGVLDFAENRVDSETGTIRVRGVFANQQRLLTGGLFVRIRVASSTPYTATLIPETAIGTDQSQKFAYVVENGVAKRRTIDAGPLLGQLRVVKSGIQAGEKVITSGIQKVRPEQNVVTQEATTKAITPEQ